MIILQNITIQRGTKFLLEDCNLTILSQQKVGVIGENGCGKSTLFAILRKESAADKGDIFLNSNIRIAHLAQETPALEQSALEYVIDGDTELRKIEKQLQHAHEKDEGELIAKLYIQYENAGGYTAKARAAQLLDGLGFSANQFEYSVKSFSGGWRMRLNLAQALMSPSDLLLLDEPTNHLDLDAVIWLEEWLKRYTGTLLLISHDRDFLDNIVDHIAHFDRKKIELYTGNYSAFEQLRAAKLAQQQALYVKQQQQREHLQKFIDRFRAKATKAKQAQSRIKALARMELIAAAHVDSSFSFSFEKPLKNPHPLINLDKVSVGYDNNIVLKNINLQIVPGARIGLLGPNGAGKSTLIQLIAGALTPISGDYEKNSETKIGYFAQHQVDELPSDETPLNYFMQLFPQTSEQQIRNYLGSFAFNGDVVFSKIGNFSGGEKSRLGLALLVWQRPNLLLLDEPTNHLDLDMRHALSMALQNYEGAMIIVSHDRHLLRTTTDNLLLVAEGQVRIFDNDLTAYEKWLVDFRKTSAQNKTDLATTNQTEKSTNNDERKLQRQLTTRLQTLERKIAELQIKVKDIDVAMGNPSLYEEANKQDLAQQVALRQGLTDQLQEAEAAWLQLFEQLETLGKP